MWGEPALHSGLSESKPELFQRERKSDSANQFLPQQKPHVSPEPPNTHGNKDKEGYRAPGLAVPSMVPTTPWAGTAVILPIF